MTVILSLSVVVLLCLYVGARRKNRVVTKKNKELSNAVYLETWGVPSNLYSTAYSGLETASASQPAENVNEKNEQNKKQSYIEDCMDDATLAYLDTLQVTASSIEDDNNTVYEEEADEVVAAMEMYEASEHYSEEDEQFFEAVRGELDRTIAESNISITEDILLSADDWEVPVTQLQIPIQYRNLAESKIADGSLGLQTWVCKVIGKEEFYLHIADSTAQTWVNAEIYNGYKEFNVGDLIYVEICRNSDNTLTLHTINCLERGTSKINTNNNNIIQNNHIDIDLNLENEAI